MIDVHEATACGTVADGVLVYFVLVKSTLSDAIISCSCLNMADLAVSSQIIK